LHWPRVGSAPTVRPEKFQIEEYSIMANLRTILITSVMVIHISACKTPDPSTSDILSGVQEGNGGDGVVCKAADGKIISVESFDLYEAEVLRGIVPVLGAPDLTPVEKLTEALKRFARLDPERAARYLEKAKSFQDNWRPVPDFVLIDIQDSNHIGLKAGCTLEQLVAYIPPKFPQDKPYIISKDLWQHLTNDHQAAVILHEIIYRELKENGAKDSSEARYFTSVILSDVLDSYDHAEYIKLLELINPNGKIPLVYLGNQARLSDYTVESDRIKMNYSLPSDQAYGPSQEIGPHKLSFRRNSTYTLTHDLKVEAGTFKGTLAVLGNACAIDTSVEFYPGTFIPSATLDCSMTVDLNGHNVDLTRTSIGKNGKITQAYLVNGATIKVAGGRLFPVMSYYKSPFNLPGGLGGPMYFPTDFHPDGSVSKAAFYDEADKCFLKSGGGEICLKKDSAHTYVEFDSKGYVIAQ
jgi:hypothetical protein